MRRFVLAAACAVLLTFGAAAQTLRIALREDPDVLDPTLARTYAPSWGSMLNSAQRFLTQAPWLAVFPGMAIFMAVLAFNLVGDGLRDALDPRRR